MSEKEILGLISIVFGIVSYVIYIRLILAGETKPHLFSWLVWTLTMAIALAAQFSDGAGPGAWGMGIATAASTIVTVLSFFYGDKDITRGDWWSLIASLAAIPLWILTKNPFGSVLLISIIDTCATYPTLRKSYLRPYQEEPIPFIISGMRNLIALFALEHFTFVTACYMIVLVILNMAIIFILYGRRIILKKT